MKQNKQHSSKFRNFKIIHELKRRIRVVAPCIHKDQERSYILEILLRKREAIEEIRVVPGIASVVIQFDPARLPKVNLFTLLDVVLGNIGTKSNEKIHEMGHDKVNLSVPHKDLNFAIGGMSCSSCALFLEMVLHRDPNISEASVNFATQTALVHTSLSKKEVFSLVKSHSYEAFSIDTLLQRKLLIEREGKQIAIAKKQFILAGLLSFPVLVIGLTRPQSGLLRLLQALLSTPVVLWNGKSFFTKAIKLAKEKTASMDTLIALGAGSAYAYSMQALFKRSQHVYFDASAGIIFFVLLGRYLEEKAKGKAGEEIRKLVDMQPQTANLLHNGQEINIGIDDIAVGDILLVRPGEKIPTDGEVIKGISSIDESMVTGVRLPVIKERGHLLTGGCVNGSGALQMRATAIGADTVLSGILHMVDQAQTSKLVIQKNVDKISAFFVPAVLAISGLTFTGWLAAGERLAHAFNNAITVLLVSCPCALGMATPAATMVSTGQSARRGIYIRNGESLETAAGITAIVFDKTGTITEGDANVTDFLNVSRFGDGKILELAASAEFNSEHFLGKAIITHARHNQIEIVEATHFHSITDRGIRARVSLFQREMSLKRGFISNVK